MRRCHQPILEVYTYGCCSYQWKKDDRPLEITGTGTGIRQVPGVGTIHILDGSPLHEGVYQCFATNELGTAVSTRTTLKRAGLFACLT